jgi:hypothetical protein
LNDPLVKDNILLRPADTIDQQRQDHIKHVVDALHSLIHDLCKGGHGCNFACSVMRLGSLIKHMDDRNLYSPRPEVPFLGLSVTLVRESISGILTPQWCLGGVRRTHRSNCEPHRCSLGDDFKAMIRTLDERIVAHKLEEFLL